MPFNRTPTFWLNHHGTILEKHLFWIRFQAERMFFHVNQTTKNLRKMLGNLDLLARIWFIRLEQPDPILEQFSSLKHVTF